MHFAPDLGFTSATTTPIAGGKIGGIAEKSFNRHIFFQSGIFFSRKGQTRTFYFYLSDSLNESVKQTLLINYFDLPVNICWKSGSQGRGRVIGGIGVTFSYIAGGRNQLQSYGSSDGKPYNTVIYEPIKPGNPIKGFDIGANFFAGYELRTGLFFRVYYTAGIDDLGLGTEIDKNRAFGVSAGYFFGKGRNINKEDDLIDHSTD